MIHDHQKEKRFFCEGSTYLQAVLMIGIGNTLSTGGKEVA
jgi:hypothetical protein